MRRAAEVSGPCCSVGDRDIFDVEDIDKAQIAIKGFEIGYGAKYLKAGAKIVDDADVLLEC